MGLLIWIIQNNLAPITVATNLLEEIPTLMEVNLFTLLGNSGRSNSKESQKRHSTSISKKLSSGSIIEMMT